jgi:hypothetical protein
MGFSRTSMRPQKVVSSTGTSASMHCLAIPESSLFAGRGSMARAPGSNSSCGKPCGSLARAPRFSSTAIAGWQKAVKRLADSGALRKVRLVTTGSKASDVQREAELLPGRKGKLARTIYPFVQLPYKTFHARAFPVLKSNTLAAYLIAGGSPPACAAVLETGSVPEYIFQTTSEWIYGECALAGRSRPTLLRMLEQLMRRGGSPVAQTTLADMQSSGDEKGLWWEWAVASELFRRAAKEGSPTPMQSLFWRSPRPTTVSSLPITSASSRTSRSSIRSAERLDARRRTPAGASGASSRPACCYWRTPTAISGARPLATQPKTSALPSALMAPLYTSPSASVNVRVPSAVTV